MEQLSREELEVEVGRLRSQANEGERVRRRAAVFESAVDFAIVTTDPNGIVTDWNRGAERTLGWTADEMIGQTVDRFFTVEDRAIGRPETEMALALRDGSAADERWHLRRDRSSFWASGEMMPLRSEDGKHQGFVKILRDRTNQRVTGERLRVSEERFRTLLEAVETAFAIVEVRFDADDEPVDYRFLEANPAFERQAGVDLRGKWVTEFAPNLERFWFETYGHVAKTGEMANFENYANTFDRWFDVRAMRVGDPSERQIAIFFNDVTERKRLEEQRSELAHEMSHRMKNVLAMAQSIATQTLRKAATMEEGRTAIAQRLAALARAQDILTRTNFAEADVREVVAAAVGPHQIEGDRIRMAGPRIQLDSQQALGLSLAIHELATNAAKYGALSNETGSVAMSWGHENGVFRFSWNEAGGPPVEEPSRRGFGSTLIERIVASYFDGEARLEFAPTGIRFTLTGASDRSEQP